MRLGRDRKAKMEMIVELTTQVISLFRVIHRCSGERKPPSGNWTYKYTWRYTVHMHMHAIPVT